MESVRWGGGVYKCQPGRNTANCSRVLNRKCVRVQNVHEVVHIQTSETNNSERKKWIVPQIYKGAKLKFIKLTDKIMKRRIAKGNASIYFGLLLMIFDGDRREEFVCARDLFSYFPPKKILMINWNPPIHGSRALGRWALCILFVCMQRM